MRLMAATRASAEKVGRIHAPLRADETSAQLPTHSDPQSLAVRRLLIRARLSIFPSLRLAMVPMRHCSPRLHQHGARGGLTAKPGAPATRLA